jgi:hypothetical protein
LLCFLPLVALAQSGTQYTISTVAGSGATGGFTGGFSGDGAAGTAAQLNLPMGLATDSAGNVYIADRGNYRIRKLTPAGIITTVAGSASNYCSNPCGDGGSAVSAVLKAPRGVTLDRAGNMYIADTDGNKIRLVDSAGIIKTIAGTGDLGPAGDGGLAVAAQLYTPRGLAVDGLGGLYIADTGNNRVRKINTAGVISTIAGTGQGGGLGGYGGGYGGDGQAGTLAQLNGPAGVALDSSGNVYIADSGNNRIRKLTPAGIITTFAGTGTSSCSSSGCGDGGSAVSAVLNDPFHVAVDSTGNVYISDYVNQRIRKVTPEGIITTIAGTGQSGFSGDGGPGVAARLDSPAGIAVDAGGNVYFSDSNNNRVRKLTPLPFEPKLTRSLNTGFHILEATLAPGGTPGFWGLEVIMSLGQAAGGFNLGGAVHPSRSNPGFGAFVLSTAQTVTATVNAQPPPGTTIEIRFLDSNRLQIGASVSGSPPLTLGKSLSPGFYIVEVWNSAGSAVTYQLGLAADFFSGGVNTGGYLDQSTVGFGAFYVPVPQSVKMMVYGQASYGASGAGSMILTLKDSQRNVLEVVRP